MTSDRINKATNNMKLARLKAGISRQELSIQSNVSLVDIKDIERGQRIPTRFQARRIAKVLNVKREKIFSKIITKGAS